MEALVPGALPESVMSVAVTVYVPGVLNITLNTCDPCDKGPSGSIAAPGSELVIWTVSVTVGRTNHWSFTALTVTVTAVPTVTEAGEPVFPVAVPGAAVSPGSNTCNLL